MIIRIINNRLHISKSTWNSNRFTLFFRYLAFFHKESTTTTKWIKRLSTDSRKIQILEEVGLNGVFTLYCVYKEANFKIYCYFHLLLINQKFGRKCLCAQKRLSISKTACIKALHISNFPMFCVVLLALVALSLLYCQCE